VGLSTAVLLGFKGVVNEWATGVEPRTIVSVTSAE
jgi:hypothetical protein